MVPIPRPDDTLSLSLPAPFTSYTVASRPIPFTSAIMLSTFSGFSRTASLFMFFDFLPGFSEYVISNGRSIFSLLMRLVSSRQLEKDYDLDVRRFAVYLHPYLSHTRLERGQVLLRVYQNLTSNSGF